MGKKIVTFLIAVSVVMGLTACNGGSGSSGDEVHLTFGMWDEVQHPYYEMVAKQYMEDNPGVTVEIQLTPWSQYWTKLDAAAGAKNAPDVYWMNVNLPKYVRAAVVEPLESYMDADNIDRGLWGAGGMEMYNMNGQQYGLPINFDSVVVAYNKTIFDKYGVDYPTDNWTWDDMVAIGEELRDKIAAEGGGEYPMVMELDGQPSFYQFMTQEGVDIYPQSGDTSNWDSPGAIKAFEDVVKLMDEGIMPEFKILSDTKGTDLFISEKAAMVYIGSWKAVVLDEASIAQNIGLVLMPAKQNNLCAVGGISYVMSAHSENKDAAWDFLNYLAGPETSKVLAENKIIMPACISAQQYYAPQFENIPGEVFVEQANISTKYPFNPLQSEWSQDVTDYTTKIFNKDVTPEEGLADLAKIIQDVLDNQ